MTLGDKEFWPELPSYLLLWAPWGGWLCSASIFPLYLSSGDPGTPRHFPLSWFACLTCKSMCNVKKWPKIKLLGPMTGRRRWGSQRPQQHLAGCEAGIFTKRECVFTERSGHTALPSLGKSNHLRGGQRVAASFADSHPMQTCPCISCDLW